MKTFNLFRTLILMGALLTATHVNCIASTTTAINATSEERVIQLEKRLNEIHNMDKHELSRMERQTLRKEVRQIKKEMAEISGGVYLSVGAIILIALLLILLL